MSAASMTEQRLSLDWELWIVEQLLFRAELDGLVDVLVSEGVEPTMARDLVMRVRRSPGFARLEARLGEARLAARLQTLERATVPGPMVPVAPDITPDALLEQHWIPSRPIKLTEAARGIAAVRSWSIAGLAERFGDVPIDVNIRREDATDPRDTERFQTTERFADFARRALEEPGNAAYVVSRSGLLANPALRPLWDDLSPLPPFLEPMTPPRGASLWMGPAGTVTPPHFDPHNVLLVQVQGTKRVRLAPRLTAALHDRVTGYYLNGSLDEVFGDQVCTVELGPGDALFVPAAWFHEVTALEPSLTLSLLSFPWPNHFHFLGPPGSDDARDAPS
jgi:hypothetical protein